MSNLRELLKDYISGEKKLPVKIASKRSAQGFCLDVVHIGNDKVFAVTSDGAEVISGLSEDHFELYTEPKKKVKIAPYIIKLMGRNAYLSGRFFKDNDDAKAYLNMREIEWIRRCDVLEIEVDDDEKNGN